MSNPFPRVTIESSHSGRPETICSVSEAVEFLLNKWPVYEGQKLNAARQCCLGALEGKATAAEARSAFIEAAKEANIFVDYIQTSK